MTIEVKESDLNIPIAINIPNMPKANLVYQMLIRSELSHQDTSLVPMFFVSTNARFTQFTVTFPTGFGDAHRNGIYTYEIKTLGSTVAITEGLVKIICEPGGGTGITNYTSTPAIEERVADVFFRPNY